VDVAHRSPEPNDRREQLLAIGGRAARGDPRRHAQPVQPARAVEGAVDATLREHLADAGVAARGEAALEVVSFLRALCFGDCPHGCPARLDAPAGAAFDAPEPWEAE